MESSTAEFLIAVDPFAQASGTLHPPPELHFTWLPHPTPAKLTLGGCGARPAYWLYHFHFPL